jgi:hypothetical protein
VRFMAEVINHPAAVIAKLIAEADGNDPEAALRVYRTAVETGAPRASVVSWISSWDLPKDLSRDAFDGFLGWFQSLTLTPASTSPESNEESVRRPEYDAADEKIRKLAERVSDLDCEAEGHKYWYFRPAWEIQSVFWTEYFGDDDPALVISSYLRDFFET